MVIDLKNVQVTLLTRFERAAYTAIVALACSLNLDPTLAKDASSKPAEIDYLIRINCKMQGRMQCRIAAHQAKIFLEQQKQTLIADANEQTIVLCDDQRHTKVMLPLQNFRIEHSGIFDLFVQHFDFSQLERNGQTKLKYLGKSAVEYNLALPPSQLSRKPHGRSEFLEVVDARCIRSTELPSDPGIVALLENLAQLPHGIGFPLKLTYDTRKGHDRVSFQVMEIATDNHVSNAFAPDKNYTSVSSKQFYETSERTKTLNDMLDDRP